MSEADPRSPPLINWLIVPAVDEWGETLLLHAHLSQLNPQFPSREDQTERDDVLFDMLTPVLELLQFFWKLSSN